LIKIFYCFKKYSF